MPEAQRWQGKPNGWTQQGDGSGLIGGGKPIISELTVTAAAKYSGRHKLVRPTPTSPKRFGRLQRLQPKQQGVGHTYPTSQVQNGEREKLVVGIDQ